jgi:hypothetical protein
VTGAADAEPGSAKPAASATTIAGPRIRGIHPRYTRTLGPSRTDPRAYLIDELSGKRSVVYEINTREIPERSLLRLKRNVTGEKAAWAFGKEFIALPRHYQLPQVPGRAGAFLCIYWG